jgi:hypothetical protein
MVATKRYFEQLIIQFEEWWNSIAPTENSKGAYIFKEMLEDKKAIQDHLSKGGKIEDLKEKFNFVKPISTSGK